MKHLLLKNYLKVNTKAASFETAYGESILVYYNPNYQADLKETNSHFTQPKMCANLVYDLNGEKAPNAVGKDIGFITVMYSTNAATGKNKQQQQLNVKNKILNQDYQVNMN